MSPEILVGLIVDPQFGQVLVLGAGGVLTELLADSVTLLPPFTPRIGRIGSAAPQARASSSSGYRGKPARDVAGADRHRPRRGPLCIRQSSTRCVEIDVNPVIVRPAGKGAVAVDTLIRLKKTA